MNKKKPNLQKLKELQQKLNKIRHVCPERRLCLAIISQAIKDLKDDTHKDEVMAYFNSELFDQHCYFLNLSSEHFRTTHNIGA